MFTVLNCVRDQHDLRLVVVAGLICLAAAVTAVGAYRRARASSGRLQGAWIVFTAFVAGAGVWATHFVAMLAYQPSLQIQYAAGVTALSFLVAVAGVGAGLGVAARSKQPWGAPAGGAAAGVGVAAMHFLGMAGVRASVDMVWDPWLVAGAVVIGMGGFSLALAAAHRANTGWRVGAAAALLVAAIVGLHFTAMGAVTLVADPLKPLPPELVGRPGLIAAVVALALVISVSAGAILWVERFSSRATLESLREALDWTPAGLAFFDAEARLMFWNAGYRLFLEGLGLTPQAGLAFRDVVVQALASDRYHARDEAAAEAWRRFDPSRAGQRLSHEMALKDGRWFLCQVNTTPTGGMVAVISDITQQHQVQAALGEAKEKAEAASLAKTQFVANISHEIRTPLHGILGVAQVMEREATDPVALTRLGMIRDSGRSLMAVLNDVLDISKIESGRMELTREVFDLRDTVFAACGAFVSMAAEKGVAFEVEIAAELAAPRFGDPGRLRQIIGNLASNAVKFTEAGRIGVTAEPSAGGVLFKVADTGVGIAPERLPDLFSRFAQLDASSTRRHGGTGLGLALSRELVELKGGRIWVESEPGQGSTFAFELPLPAAEAEAQAAEPDAAVNVAVSDERALRVLAAEDNATNRYILNALLEHAGVELTLVENGQEAVEAMAVGGFDLVLMDVQMPVLDGVSATRAIRAGEAGDGRTRTPIIALSANVLDFQKAEYIQAGMDAIVAKPIDAAALLSAIDECLAAAA